MGKDKALLTFKNTPLIVHEIQILEFFFKEVVLITNNRKKFSNIFKLKTYTIFEDIYPDKGPICGIYTALKMCKQDYVFIMACDMPTPNQALIEAMYKSLQSNQILVASYQKKLEPLFAFYHQSCLPIIENQINNNQLRIRDIFSKLKTSIYPVDSFEQKALTNLNTPQDFEQWCQQENK